ncbi:MAG TPA: IS1595 family transposase [Acidimicrobiales bacterium]|jgi:transposase-like protein
MAQVDRNNPKRAASSESSWSLMEFLRDFPDDAACLEWLWRTRYSPDGEHAHCPKCDRERVFKKYAMCNRNTSWSCTGCGHHVHPTAGTIFHKSSTSLKLWFYAMYLMVSTRCGISAKQLERELGVTYKTAWRMFHLIRNELMVQDDTEPFSGEVEIDETFVGGKPRQADRARYSHLPTSAMRQSAAVRHAMSKKVTVLGMVERGGRVAAHVVPRADAESIMPHVVERVLPESTVYTDEATHYTASVPNAGYQHRRIHHKARVYVEGDVHTNTIEGFWSLVKSSLRGTHHAVSAKYLQGYLNEYVWRYNRRDDRRAMFWSLLLRAAVPVR